MHKNVILLVCGLLSMNPFIANEPQKKGTFRQYAEKGLQLTGAAISATAGLALCKWEWNRMCTADAASTKHVDKAYEHFGNWYKMTHPNEVPTNKNINLKEFVGSQTGEPFLSNNVKIMHQTDPNNPYFAEMDAARKYDYGYRPVGIALLAAIPISIACYLVYKCFFAEKNQPKFIDE